jgi:hypothetical protein
MRHEFQCATVGQDDLTAEAPPSFGKPGEDVRITFLGGDVGEAASVELTTENARKLGEWLLSVAESIERDVAWKGGSGREDSAGRVLAAEADFNVAVARAVGIGLRVDIEVVRKEMIFLELPRSRQPYLTRTRHKPRSATR